MDIGFVLSPPVLPLVCSQLTAIWGSAEKHRKAAFVLNDVCPVTLRSKDAARRELQPALLSLVRA